MDEFELTLSVFCIAIIFGIVGIVRAEIHFRRQRAQMNRELEEIDEQIALSGYVLGDCPHGGHQGRDCPSMKGKA